MRPVNRITKYYDSRNRNAERANTPRLTPACKTTRIGRRAPDDPSMSVWDVLGAVAWCAAVTTGLVAGLWVAGVVLGCGIRVGLGL